MGGDDEEDVDGAGDASDLPKQPAPPTVPEGPEPRRLPLYATLGLWGLAFALVWVAGGLVSRTDQMCVSCHIDGSIHALRIQAPAEDPHGAVECVSCHETGGLVASATTKVPWRAAHFVRGYLEDGGAKGYGSPVANSTCLACHRVEVASTQVDPERGIRVSHTEPLEQGALCNDCHRPRPNTGVIDRYTVGMDPCLRCHDGEQASAECDLCHTKDIGLAVQASSVVKPRAHQDIVRCEGCHKLDTCDACHGVRLPHSSAFMNGGHARQAVEDIWYNNGQVCNRCHTKNRRSCGNCHRNQFPSHPESYMPKGHQSADPYNNGCTQCHDYLEWMHGRNFCGELPSAVWGCCQPVGLRGAQRWARGECVE